MELVITWASDKNRDPGLSEGTLALEIINDKELINGAGPFENSREEVLKKNENKINEIIVEVKNKCLMILLRAALSIFIEGLSSVKAFKYNETTVQLALKILDQYNLNTENIMPKLIIIYLQYIYYMNIKSLTRIQVATKNYLKY